MKRIVIGLLLFCVATIAVAEMASKELQLQGSPTSTGAEAATSSAALVAPTQHVNSINWPDPAQADQEILHLLPPEDQAKVPASPVPVLVPRSPALAGGISMLVGPNWYSATYSGRHIYFSLSAMRIVYRSPHVTSSLIAQFATHAVTLRHTAAHIMWNDEKNTWGVSWEEFNVAYYLEYGCGLVRTPTCSEDYLRSLVNDLVFVGGSSAS